MLHQPRSADSRPLETAGGSAACTRDDENQGAIIQLWSAVCPEANLLDLSNFQSTKRARCRKSCL
jgi:hypothetical protein